MNFYAKAFDALTLRELHDAYALRAAVFVVEQACAYQDPDDKDTQSLHVFLYENKHLAAYCRLVPPGIAYEEPAIGRVAVVPGMRKKGVGKALMHFAVKTIQQLYQYDHIVISAQCYLERFYTDLGFVTEGDPYLEDDIPHIRMRYSSKAASQQG